MTKWACSKSFKNIFLFENCFKKIVFCWLLTAECSKVMKCFAISDESHKLYIYNKKLTTTTRKPLKFMLFRRWI